MKILLGIIAYLSVSVGFAILMLILWVKYNFFLLDATINDKDAIIFLAAMSLFWPVMLPVYGIIFLVLRILRKNFDNEKQDNSDL